jgi:hypothetical protein
MQRLSNNPQAQVDEVIQGLRRLVRIGQVTPDSVLAVPELAGLPLHMGRDERGPEAAISVANALIRAIDSTSARDTARMLFGVDKAAVSRSLSERRALAASTTSVTPGSFRVRREPRLLDELARVLLVELVTTQAPRPRPSSGAHLEIERGPVRTTIPISASRSPILIGRDPDCGIELRDDPAVSRHHAQLSLVDGAWVIEDLGSTNGTEIEAGSLRGCSRLVDGDVITIGHTRLTLRIDEDDPATTVAR